MKLFLGGETCRLHPSSQSNAIKPMLWRFMEGKSYIGDQQARVQKRRKLSLSVRAGRPSEGIQPDATSLIGDTPLVQTPSRCLRRRLGDRRFFSTDFHLSEDEMHYEIDASAIHLGQSIGGRINHLGLSLFFWLEGDVVLCYPGPWAKVEIEMGGCFVTPLHFLCKVRTDLFMHLRYSKAMPPFVWNNLSS